MQIFPAGEEEEEGPSSGTRSLTAPPQQYSQYSQYSQFPIVIVPLAKATPRVYSKRHYG